jgi:osmotically inducible lipoprotein OsmB
LQLSFTFLQSTGGFTMMKAIITVCISLAAALTLAGCGTRAETVGTVGGAAVGAGVGSSVTGGGALGTVGGAAAGGVVGHELGKEYDKRHR